MLSDAHHFVRPADAAERAYLESLIREDFDRCHPGETLEDIKRRAAFEGGPATVSGLDGCRRDARPGAGGDGTIGSGVPAGRSLAGRQVGSACSISPTDRAGRSLPKDKEAANHRPML